MTYRPSDNPWSTPAEDVLTALDTSIDGLTEKEARRRIEQVGPNRLREIERRSIWSILWDQVKSLIMLLLVVAMFVSFATGQSVEGIAIAVVILVNTAIGFVTEWRAVRSMEALRNMAQVQALVRRAGKEKLRPTSELVPGDIVVLKEGEVIPADLRLIEIDNLQVDESALTGESVPLAKKTDRVDEEAALADRLTMAYRGTAVSKGSGIGVVTGTGMETELGAIAEMVEAAGAAATPLEKKLHRLGRRLVWLTLGVAAVITGAGLLAGRDTYLMIETGIALAVAAIPEGLPIVATVALAYGMHLMMRRNAFIRRLSSVETLGATTIICTDKTGTLTKNDMTVRRLKYPGGCAEFSEEGNDIPEEEAVRIAAEAAVLCNDADEESGDPMELALLEFGRWMGLDRTELIEEMPEIREETFSSETKMMATFHESDDGILVAVKGAPEAVLDRCSRVWKGGSAVEFSNEERKRWHEVDDEMAEDGLRVLGLARRIVDEVDADPYDELCFLGFVGLLDPPKDGVRSVVEQCKKAGIRVVMVTGDHPATALNISRAVGVSEDGSALEGSEFPDPDRSSDDEMRRVLEADVIARVTPKQKLNLVEFYQNAGEIVAMTGDGVNDAPALRSADIGVAMGKRGTQVAREAADMVLQDDELSTMVAAIEQGRVIFENIRKFVVYLLSGNVGEILAVGVAATAGTPLPLLPLQILYINIINDVFPALALGAGRGIPEVMQEPPRDPQEPVITRRGWAVIGGYGVMIAITVLGVFFLALYFFEMNSTEAVTVSFLTLSIARLLHVFNMRRPGSGILVNEITRNPHVWAAIALCMALLLGAVYVPFVAEVLSVAPPERIGWLLIAAGSLTPLVLGQLFVSLSRERKP